MPILRIGNKFKSKIDNKGFTLIEIIIVLAIISIVTLFSLPQIGRFFNGKEKNMALLTTMITKTFDDSFLNDRINYLVVHLSSAGDDEEKKESLFQRQNGLSVANLKNGNFVETKRRLLQNIVFSNSFKLQEILLSNGTTISEGNVFIQFNTKGFSENFILHIEIDDEKWSVRNYKHLKDPKVEKGLLDFEEFN